MMDGLNLVIQWATGKTALPLRNKHVSKKSEGTGKEKMSKVLDKLNLRCQVEIYVGMGQVREGTVMIIRRVSGGI